MRFLTSLLCASLLAAAPMSQASANIDASGDLSIDELMDLNIEDLVTVSVASKKDETIKEAPSVISVVTQQDIQRYGGLSLADILNRVPSLQIYSSAFLPSNSLSVRGQSNQHYPNRILFLINNRPFRDATTGGWVAPLLTQFPVSAIEKLEIIRGPGSVLYGTGAFSSVINIVTKTDIADENGQISTTIGSRGRRDIEGSWGHDGDDWHVYSALKDSYADGWKSSLTAEAGTSGSFDRDEDGNGYFLDARYKDFSFNIFKGRSEETSLGPTIRFPTRPMEINRMMIDVGYEADIHEDWSIAVNATHNNFVLDNSASTGHADNTEDNYLGEITLRGNLTQNLSALVGATFEHYDGETSDDDFQSQRSGGYVQFDYMPTEWLKFVAGMQLNKPKNVKKDFSPRAAMIADLNDLVTFKLMYGEAFRSASGIESFINIPGALVGNSSVAPEKIATTEAQVLYDDGRFNAAFTGYISRISDIIGRVPFAGGGQTLGNTGSETYKGIEVEGKYLLGNGWAMEGSMLLQRSENSANIENPNFTTNIMAKAGVTYNSDQGWSVGLFDSYFGDPEDVRNIDASVAEVNPQPKAYHWVTGNVNIDVSKFLDKENRLPKMTFSLYGENLLDEDVDYPEFNRKNINSIPSAGGRAVYARFTVKF